MMMASDSTLNDAGDRGGGDDPAPAGDREERSAETGPAGSAVRAPWTARPLILLVRLYQITLRPFMGRHCRFQPTCSDYSVEALATHGALRGSWLTVRRLLRCHPLGGFGYDPVPPRRSAEAPSHDDSTTPSPNDHPERTT